MSDPLVTRIQPLRPRGLRVLVHLDHGEPVEVMLEALERNRLGVGDTLSRAQRDQLLSTDADVRVRDAAMNLISYRARTRAELRRRLRQKGFEPARIEPCLARLEAKGFVDDDAVAAAFVRDRLRHRPRGRARLVSELQAKGVPRDAADGAVARVFEDEGTGDAALVLEVAEQWVARQGDAVLTALAHEGRSPERDKARRRLRGYLARRGFRGADARAGEERAIDRAREAATAGRTGDG